MTYTIALRILSIVFIILLSTFLFSFIIRMHPRKKSKKFKIGYEVFIITFFFIAAAYTSWRVFNVSFLVPYIFIAVGSLIGATAHLISNFSGRYG